MRSSFNSQDDVDAKQSVWLIVGLGNPGAEYEKTYHNVGFRVLDRMAGQYGVRLRQQCGAALISDRFTVQGQSAVLVAPQTFMNRSGQALPKVFERFGTTIRSVVAVYDELDLPLGRIRIRQKGSAGGHNGIKSLISACGSDEFIRIRVGIRPDHPIGETSDFVLSRVSRSDRETLDQAEDVAVKAVETLLGEGIEKAMAAFNGIDLKKTEETK